mmetsp:Transcript_143515/g.267472  ORF Transcript_143515/g.267472 Transcript_143515/m.267472 type:complete len:205 (+) Transcript_143515:3-617(+)
MRSESKEGKLKETLSRGAEIEERYKADRSSFCAAQSERHRQCLENHKEDVESRKKMLRNRFKLVDESVSRAHHEAESKAQLQSSKLQQKLTRSADHLESCRLNLGLKQQQKHMKEQEREHQILRMSRLKDYQRFVRIEGFKKDQALFNDCKQEQIRTQSLLSLAADRASMGYSAPLPESLRSLADMPMNSGQQSPRSPGLSSTR